MLNNIINCWCTSKFKSIEYISINCLTRVKVQQYIILKWIILLLEFKLVAIFLRVIVIHYCNILLQENERNSLYSLLFVNKLWIYLILKNYGLIVYKRKQTSVDIDQIEFGSNDWWIRLLPKQSIACNHLYILVSSKTSQEMSII